jgi:hypothetical protein
MAVNSDIRRASFEPGVMPLDAARTAFTWLVTGPDPVSVDGGLFPGLPHRRLPLNEVRARLLRRGCGQATRDAVWAHLVLRSRTEGATWTLGCVGVALPALTRIAATLTARFAGDPSDIHAAVLTGFVSELARIDLRKPRVMLRLRWAAYRGGHIALREALDAPIPSSNRCRSSEPAPILGASGFRPRPCGRRGCDHRERGRVDRLHPPGRPSPGHRCGAAWDQLRRRRASAPARRIPAGGLPVHRRPAGDHRRG